MASMDTKQKQILKELKERSGIGFTKCKKVLEENNWDMEKSIVALKEIYKEFAIKKSQVNTDSGLIIIKKFNDQLHYSILRCQTDTIPQTPEFSKLANDVIDANYNNQDTLPHIEKAMISFSSNITLDEIKQASSHNTNFYIHHKLSDFTGLKAAIVTLEHDNQELAKDIAMNIVFYEKDSIQDIIKEKNIKDTKNTINNSLNNDNNKITNIIYLTLNK